MIKCSRCKEYLDESRFTIDMHSRRGFSSACKPCRNSGNRLKRSALARLRLEHKLTRSEKTCSKCGVTKPVNMFGAANSAADGRESRCKDCRKTYMRSVQSPRKNKRVSDFKLECIEILGGECSSCGIKPSTEWPLDCFDFHHISDKGFSISRMMQSWISFDKVREEIKKCTVLCANCHRKHHAAGFRAPL